MKTVIVYTVPMDSPEVWDEFKPLVKRFCHSMRNTEPGCDYEIMAMINHPDPPKFEATETMHIFDGLPMSMCAYAGKGCDVGSFLFYAQNSAAENEFMVCMNTRTFAWKAGWLRRLVEAREMFGPGLYATAVSREGGKLHACCRCFAVDSDDFKKYPHKIESRDQGQFFESGGGNLMEWYYEQNSQVNAIYWSGVCGGGQSTIPEDFLKHENIYRRGDQSNMLIKDRHTLIYDEASPEEKLRLQRMCFEGVVDIPPATG